MKLVIIYGPPAAGKLTVAKELSRKTGYPIFHNHVTIDAVESVFSSDTDFFWDLNGKMRLMMMEEAAREKIPGLIFTFCYEYTSDNAFMRKVIRAVEKHGGSVHLVHLYCDEASLVTRVQHLSRKKFKKIKTTKRLRELLQRHEFYKAYPYRKGLSIDNTKRSAKEVARMIIDTYKL